MKTFRCAMCDEEFEEEGTEEEAQDEYEQKFCTKYSPENTIIVCDDCYNMMIFIYPIEQYLEERDRKN